MKTNFLLSNKLRKPGIFLLTIGTIIGIYFIYFEGVFVFLETKDKGGLYDMSNNNLTDELAAILVIVGAVFIGFSKEKIEDEYTTKLRLDALAWAVYANYIILLGAVVTVYGDEFFTVMTYNMFTILYIFILRYQYLLRKSAKA